MSIGHLITLSGVLFTLGMVGVLSRRNILIVLLSVELMLNAAALALVAFGSLQGNLDGQVFVFFILTVAAAEAAIGLAILVVLFRSRQTIDVAELDDLKG